MRLFQIARHPIELRAAPASALNRQARCLQRLEELPACCVHSSGILEWCFCLSEYLFEEFRFFLEEHSNIQCSLCSIALLACQTEVAHPIGSPVSSGLYMLNLEGAILLPAIGAGSIELLQQVLSGFIACQCSLLVLTTGNFGVLLGLHIEAYKLHTDRSNGAKASQS